MSSLLYTPQQIRDARDWIADAYPANPLDDGDEHPVFTYSPNAVYAMVSRRYPGGWQGFTNAMAPVTAQIGKSVNRGSW